MQRDHAYHKLQNLLLQEFQNKQLLGTPGAVKDFLHLAAAKGFYVDDLIRMAESGMSARQIAETVVSADRQENEKTLSPPRRPQAADHDRRGPAVIRSGWLGMIVCPSR